MRVETAGGDIIDLGTTETAPTIGIVDYSRRVTDEFGVTTVVERGFARRMSVRLAVPFDQVDGLQRRLASLRATSALWVAGDGLDWLSVTGFYKDFAPDLAVPPLSYCTLEVEGLAAAEPFADPGTDPAPDARTSTLQLLRPAAVNDAALAYSNVAENDHPEWSAGTTYAVGARVIRAATHRIYESLAAVNIGNDPAGSSGKWLDLGPTNRWAMFDQALGTVTHSAAGIFVVLSAGTINAVALLDVVADAVRVEAPGYDRYATPDGKALTFLDMPATSGLVTVTIAGASPVSIGTLLIGTVAGLGITEAAPTAGITDYSRKEVDDFGEVTVVPRAWAKRMATRALIRTDAVDIVANRIAAVRARPSLWIGQAGVDSLTVYGFFKDFSIAVGENVSTLSLSIEGLSTAAPIVPATGPVVAWPDIADPDGTKPDNGATKGAPAGTDVAGVPAEQLVVRVVDMEEVLAPSGAVFSAIAEIDASLDETSAELAASSASVADLQTRSGVIEQRINVRPNLVPGIEAGTAGWTGDLSGFFFAATSTWGAIAISSSITGSGGVASPLFVVQPNEWYTVSGDPIIIAETGLCYFDIVFLRADGSIAGDGPEHLIFTPRDFSTDGSGHTATAIEAQAPADAVHGVARFIWGNVTGITWLGFRLLKAERGRLPFTSYTSDATVVALDAAVRTETLVRTNAVTALSQRTDLIDARVTNAENAALASGAAFQEFVQTIAGVNAAQAIFNTGISAQVTTAQGTADNALQAANEASAGVASEQIVRANAVAAQAERVDTVVAQLSGAAGSGLKAQIDANATAAADANTAVASSLQVVRARPFSTGNLLTNTDYAVDGAGWQTYASIGTVSFARDLAGDSWRPLPEHTLGVYQSDATSGAIGVYYQDVPAVAGEWYIAAAYAAAHRTTISLGVEFRDAAGTQIGVANPGYFPVGTGGTDLNLYSRLWAKGQAPAGTTSARFVFIKGQTTPGEADSFAWMVRPSLSVATAEQDQPPAYSPGSARAALAAQGAVVAQHAATLATHDGKLQAFLEQTTSVPGATAAVILKAAMSDGGSTSSVALLAQALHFFLEGSDPSEAILAQEIVLVGGVPTIKLYGNLETYGSVSFGNLRLDTLRSFVSDGDPAQYYNTLPGSFLPIAGLSLNLPNVKPTGAIEMRLTGSIWATGTDGAAPYFDSALIITLVGSIAGTHSVSVAPPENFSTRFLNDTLVVDVMLDGAAFEGDVGLTAALYRGNTVIPSADPLQPEYRSVSVGAENIAIKAKWRFA